MPATTPTNAPNADDAVRAVVRRLSRPHPSGGAVIERAAILAEGPHVAAILEWITAHAGQPETADSVSAGGLHGSRMSGPVGGDRRKPQRYVLPPGALA